LTLFSSIKAFAFFSKAFSACRWLKDTLLDIYAKAGTEIKLDASITYAYS